MTKRIGKYEVIEQLASGGFGVTYLAIDTTKVAGKSPCVIKQYHPLQKFDSDLDADMKRRFKKEAEILRKLSQMCKQIPMLLDEFSVDGELYIVQEFIEGKTLDSKVRNKGKIPETEAKKILVSLLSVLHYIHSRNIIHRDISPDNIIIREKDQKPVLIDFGAVKEVVTTVLDSKGFPLNLTIAIGKKNYSPPEQFLFGQPKFQSDIYSLSLTIIFLLTGKSPDSFSRDDLKEIKWREYAANVSNRFKDVLDKAIMWDYSKRYESASDMLEALNVTVIDNQRKQRSEELTTVIRSKKKEERDKIQTEIDRRLQEAKKIVRDYFEYLEQKAEEERRSKEREDAIYKEKVRRTRRQRKLAKLAEEQADILSENKKNDSQNSDFDFSDFKWETEKENKKDGSFKDIFETLFGGNSIGLERDIKEATASVAKNQKNAKKNLTLFKTLKRKIEGLRNTHPIIYFTVALLVICIVFVTIIYILITIISILQ